ncbi:MAG: S8 family serine peptidase [Anaerolineae bacterium]|jgi:hypothetical protein|nr:S8 family serine peptidase [Anaerolineae bacterium]
MMKPKTWRWFSLLVVLSMLLSATGVFAATSQPPAPVSAPVGLQASNAQVIGEIPGSKDPALYIVRLHDPALASYFGGIAGLAATSPRATGASKLDPQAPASVAYLNYLEAKHSKALAAVESALGRPVTMTFQYLAVLNGFAVTLTPAEAAKVAQLPEVQAVYRDVERELDTEVGPGHIGAPEIWNGNTGNLLATRGEGIIIGMIDSGINHAHPAFAATDGDGYTHTNPYGAGVYKGWCVANPSFCNDKLIAAYGFNPAGGDPEDLDGHGSHTASTAGGNRHEAHFNVGTTPYTITISGVAPRANIVAYKVCNPSCPGTASVAAVNSAILNDEVDVLNYSISGSDSPWTDSVDLAFLDAYNAGIFVSASAGNNGPGASTVAKTGPWNAAVAASTHNRVIAHTVDVTGPTTPPELQGMAAVPGEGTALAADVVDGIKYDPTNSNGCTAFSAGFFTGNMALIQRGGCTFTIKVDNAVAAGATGVVLFNNVGGPPSVMGGLTGTPPAVMIDLADGTALRDYIVLNPTATVRINLATSYMTNTAWEDIMAGFSSRGPSQFELVKPDYTAPGVNILAAVAAPATGSPATYDFLGGTSMSSPHGAGAAALMVALYPDWSPAEIKSALASTALDVLLKEDGITPANPFDMGSGLLNLGGASNAGLVFDETYANYVAANPAIGGDPKTLNQPSMANYNCAGACSWTRTVKAVVTDTWTTSFDAPAGMTITVDPSSFSLDAGATQVLTITADVSGLPLNQWAFGDVMLTPGVRETAFTHMPVVVYPTDAVPDIDVTPTSLAATQAPDTTTNQILNIGNVGTLPLNWSLLEAPLAAPLALMPEGDNSINAPISLVLDDGTGDNNIGIGGASQFIFLNRFTPAAGAYPITLNQVQIYFDASGLVNIGDDMLLALYENTSGNTDPAVGSNLLSTVPVTVTALNAWNVYDLAAPVTFNGPGDILIGVVALEMPGTDYWPAALDQTVSQQRSWAGWWGEPTAPTPPTLPPTTWTLIDAYFAGNWMVRGYGEGTAVGCDSPADVPWLTVNPISGAVAAGGSTPLTVGFDSTGLALGSYDAVLCVESDDPDTPLVEVPVSLTVEQGGACTVEQLYFSDFETDDGGWTSSGFGEWEWGTPVTGVYALCDTTPRPEPAGAFSGSNTWATNLDGCYANSGEQSLLVSQTFDFSSVQAPIELNWQNWYEIFTTFDMGEVYVNGTLLWNVVSSTATLDWQPESVDLSAYAGQANVEVTFRLFATTVVNRMGWYVDDVEITGCIPTGDPNIDVDPLSMSSTQPPDTITSQTLDIGNTGAADLLWELFEDSTAASPRMADWSDNFDSYVTGSQLHGQGGWKGWGDEPAAGALTSNAQAASAPNSVAILGASDLVHEYGGVNSGQWTYTAWQYIPTDFTGQSYFILLNSYDDAGSSLNWSAQVMFDGGTNLVTNDGGVSGGSLALVKDQWVELRLELDLDADTGAFYYDNQLLYTGTWSGQVSGAGAVNLAAVNLFANNASVIYYDDMSLVQAASVCDAPSDIPWLSTDPISGTTAPAATTPVDMTFDSTGLVPGTYNANLCVISNDPDPGPGNGTDLVVVPVELVVEQAPPNIFVNPLSFSATQAPDTTSQQTLTISNTGEVTLDWTIDEENITTFPLMAGGLLVAASATEDIDAIVPSVASKIEPGPASPSVWAPRAVLYDNGPLVTHPGGGAGGADESRLQTTSLGMSTLGLGAQVLNNNWVADDFTVTDATGWTLDSATFFAYQTNSPLTSTITSINWVLYDGDPSVGGAMMASGSGMLSTLWTNIYRTSETTIGVTNRPIMATTVDMGALFLPAGTYWLAWQADGTLSSGPWAPPITILGQTTTGNGLQSLGGTAAWAPANDSGTLTQQGFPFVLEGSVGGTPPPCVYPSAIPWLSLDAMAGSLGGGAATDVMLTFDSTGMVDGTYTGNVCVFSNDPDAGPGNETELVIVPVELIVETGSAVTLAALATGSTALWSGLALLGVFGLGIVVWRRKQR